MTPILWRAFLSFFFCGYDIVFELRTLSFACTDDVQLSQFILVNTCLCMCVCDAAERSGLSALVPACADAARMSLLNRTFSGPMCVTPISLVPDFKPFEDCLPSLITLTTNAIDPNASVFTAPSGNLFFNNDESVYLKRNQCRLVVKDSDGAIVDTLEHRDVVLEVLSVGTTPLHTKAVSVSSRASGEWAIAFALLSTCVDHDIQLTPIVQGVRFPSTYIQVSVSICQHCPSYDSSYMLMYAQCIKSKLSQATLDIIAKVESIGAAYSAPNAPDYASSHTGCKPMPLDDITSLLAVIDGSTGTPHPLITMFNVFANVSPLNAASLVSVGVLDRAVTVLQSYRRSDLAQSIFGMVGVMATSSLTACRAIADNGTLLSAMIGTLMTHYPTDADAWQGGLRALACVGRVLGSTASIVSAGGIGAALHAIVTFRNNRAVLTEALNGIVSHLALDSASNCSQLVSKGIIEQLSIVKRLSAAPIDSLDTVLTTLTFVDGVDLSGQDTALSTMSALTSTADRSTGTSSLVATLVELGAACGWTEDACTVFSSILSSLLSCPSEPMSVSSTVPAMRLLVVFGRRLMGHCSVDTAIAWCNALVSITSTIVGPTDVIASICKCFCDAFGTWALHAVIDRFSDSTSAVIAACNAFHGVTGAAGEPAYCYSTTVGGVLAAFILLIGTHIGTPDVVSSILLALSSSVREDSRLDQRVFVVEGGVELVVRAAITHPANIDIQTRASTVLYPCASEDDVRKRLIDVGFIQHGLAALVEHAVVPAVVSGVSSVLKRIALTPEYVPAIISADAIPTVLTCISGVSLVPAETPADVTVFTALADLFYLLFNIASVSPKPVLDAGLVSAITSLLQSQDSSRKGFAGLRQCLLTGLGKIGLVHSCAVMQQLPHDAKVQVDGSLRLFLEADQMASGSNVDFILQPNGGIESILSAMRNHPNNADVQSHTAYALYCFSVDPQCAEAIRAKGCVPLLLAAVDNATEYSSVDRNELIEHITLALSRLELKAVFECIASHPSDPEVNSCACGSLERLVNEDDDSTSVDAERLVTVLGLGGMQYLRSLLTGPLHDNDAVLTGVCGVLDAIGLCESGASAVVADGAILTALLDTISRLLESGPHDALFRPIHTLRVFAHMSPTLGWMASSDSRVLPLLSTIMSTVSPSCPTVMTEAVGTISSGLYCCDEAYYAPFAASIDLLVFAQALSRFTDGRVHETVLRCLYRLLYCGPDDSFDGTCCRMEAMPGFVDALFWWLCSHVKDSNPSEVCVEVMCVVLGNVGLAYPLAALSMFPDHALLAQSALKAVLTVIKNSGDRYEALGGDDELVRLCAPELILRAMNKHISVAAVQRHCATLVQHLSDSTSAMERFVQLDALSSALISLQTHAACDTVAGPVCEMLLSVLHLSSSAQRSKFFEDKGCDAVFQAAEHHSSDPEVCGSVLGAMIRLTEVNPPVGAFSLEKAVSFAFTVLRTHAGNALAVDRTCSLLDALAKELGEEYTTEARSLLLPLLDTLESRSAVARALSALTQFMVHDLNCNHCIDSSVAMLPSVVRVMRRLIAKPAVFQAGLRFILYCARSGVPAVLTTLADVMSSDVYGMLAASTDLMGEEEVAQRFADVTVTICIGLGPEIIPTLAGGGAVELMCAAMRTHASQFTIQCHCTMFSALAAGSSRSVVDRLLAAGLTQLLEAVPVTFPGTEHSCVVKWSAAALRRLSQRESSPDWVPVADDEFTEPLRVNDRVRARCYEYEDWYNGIITRAAGLWTERVFSVLYDDGNTARDLRGERCIQRLDEVGMPARVFSVGDTVKARFRGSGKWFQGEVSAVHHGATTVRYDIRYEDGDVDIGLAAVHVMAVEDGAGEGGEEGEGGVEHEAEEDEDDEDESDEDRGRDETSDSDDDEDGIDELEDD